MYYDAEHAEHAEHAEVSYVFEIYDFEFFYDFEADNVWLIWADDVFLNPAIGEPDAMQTKVMSEDVSLDRNADMVRLVEEKTELSEVLGCVFHYDYGQEFVSQASEAPWLRDFYGFEKWLRDFLRLPGAVARAVLRRLDMAEFVNLATLEFGYFVN